jgi:hypothetical protein
MCRAIFPTPDNKGAALRRYWLGIPRRSVGTERLSGRRPFDDASQKRIAGALSFVRKVICHRSRNENPDEGIHGLLYSQRRNGEVSFRS